MPVLDELDRKIIQEMTKGVNSYEDLADKCSVTRSTVYRRVNSLEKAGIITGQIHVGLNFEKLDLITLHVGINVESKDEEKAIEALRKVPEVKMVWRTYGAYNLVLIVFCHKGNEGRVIDGLREIFEGVKVKSYDVSVGFLWEKMDMTPF